MKVSMITDAQTRPLRHATHPETIQEYTHRLQVALGIRDLSADSPGRYAHVFEHPTMPDVAVKVLPTKCTRYLAFATFCWKESRASDRTVQPRNEWIPYVHSIHLRGDIAIVFLERLHRLWPSDLYYSFVKDASGKSVLDENDIEFWWAVAETTDDCGLKRLAKFLGQYRFRDALDLNHYNVMLRSSSPGLQIVICDPIAEDD